MHLATPSFREILSVNTILTLRVLKRGTPIFYSFSFARSSSNDKQNALLCHGYFTRRNLIASFYEKKTFVKKNQSPYKHLFF